MPFALSISTEKRLCYVSLTGRIKGYELLKAIRDIIDHPHWGPGLNSLWDGLGITDFSLDAPDLDQIRSIIDEYARRSGPGKVAFVVRRQEDITTANLFKLLLHIPGREIQVFGSIEEANEWMMFQDLDTCLQYLREL